MSTRATAVFDAYMDAVLAGDRRRAFAEIEQGRRAGMTLPEIYMDVFQPALRRIGRLWQENRISVADEHLATAITQAAMARLYEQVYTVAEPAAQSIVAACADSERHEVGLRMLCDLLELAGWETTYLGATVPIEALVSMVERRRPDVLALSIALTPHLPRLRAMIEAVRAAMGANTPFIIVGGRPFLERPELAAQVGADATATDAREAVTLVRERTRAA